MLLDALRQLVTPTTPDTAGEDPHDDPTRPLIAGGGPIDGTADGIPDPTTTPALTDDELRQALAAALLAGVDRLTAALDLVTVRQTQPTSWEALSYSIGRAEDAGAADVLNHDPHRAAALLTNRGSFTLQLSPRNGGAAVTLEPGESATIGHTAPVWAAVVSSAASGSTTTLEIAVERYGTARNRT